MPSSLILDTVARAAFPTVMVFSLYMLFVGHNAPGGGFVGGLVASAALVLRYIAGGPSAVLTISKLRYEVLLGAGLATAGLTGAAAWMFGAQFLESGILDLHLPVLGDIHIVSALFFDIGVYFIVIGLLLGVLSTLGGAPGKLEHGPSRPEDATR